MQPLVVALLVAGLAADDPVTPTVPAGATSPTAQIITVTLAGIASIIVAAAGFANMRKRKQAEADAAPAAEVVIPLDPEDRPSKLRERLAAVETMQKVHTRQIEELTEQMTLRRAADVVFEADNSPRRRRRTSE